MVKRTLFAILAMVAIICATNLPMDLVSVASAQEAVIQPTASESDEFPRVTSCDDLGFTSMTVVNETGDATRVDIMFEVTPGDILRFRLSQYESGYRMHDIQCNPKAGKVLVVYSAPYPGGHTQLRASTYDTQTLVWSPIEIPFLGVSFGWPQVEAISDGFLVSFAYYTSGANGQQVRGIIVGANGSVSESFVIIDQAPFQFVHDLTCGADSTCVVATQSGGSQIRLALWTADGVKPIELTPTGSYPLVAYDIDGRVILLYHNSGVNDTRLDPIDLPVSEFASVMAPTAQTICGTVFTDGGWSSPQPIAEGFATDIMTEGGAWIIAWHSDPGTELGPFYVDLLRYAGGAFARSNLATVDSDGGDFGPVLAPFRRGHTLVTYSHCDMPCVAITVQWLDIDWKWEWFIPKVDVS